MKNEEKILSMLDLIAQEVKNLREITVTKEEFQSFKDEMYSFKDEMYSFKDEMIVFKKNTETKLQSIDQKINEQTKLLDARFDVLNERLFKQEAQIMILRREKAQ
ncbi:MAG TPA: hypothetical protein GX521_07115 [Firmicutes bacterium]|nr:hypothetical protein [Bacillota bacterium]